MQKTVDSIAELYERSTEWLDEEYAFFLTHVLNIGRPRWDDRIPTAAVMLPEDNPRIEDFEFIFNTNFAEQLNQLGPEAGGFILAHETMHILMNHLRLAQQLAPKGDKFREVKARAFNIAADCVINDWLAMGGMPVVEEDDFAALRGDKVVGYNCAFSTVTEVFDDVMKKMRCAQCGKPFDMEGKGQQGDQQQDGSGQGQEGEKGDQEGQGQGGGEGEGSEQDAQGGGHTHGDSGEFCECPGHYSLGDGGGLDDHTWMHESTDAQQKAADKMYDQVADQAPAELDEARKELDYDDSQAGIQAGRGHTNPTAWAEEQGVSLAWAELLKEIDPDIFRGPGAGPPPRASYHRPRRKLMGMYPDVLLPVTRKDPRDEKNKKGEELPSIVIALDTSGSIPEKMRHRFVTLAKSIPQDKIKLHACTFTDVYMPLDLENPQFRSGGTEFSAIVDFIDKEVLTQQKNYPKAVVVITDGHAGFYRNQPTREQFESWYWLLDGNGPARPNYPPSKVDMLQKYTA